MANMIYADDPSCGIKKKVLHASRKDLPEFPNDTRVNTIYLIDGRYFCAFAVFIILHREMFVMKY